MQIAYLPLPVELAGVRVSERDAVGEHTDATYKNDGLNTEVPGNLCFLVSIIFIHDARFLVL